MMYEKYVRVIANRSTKPEKIYRTGFFDYKDQPLFKSRANPMA